MKQATAKKDAEIDFGKLKTIPIMMAGVPPISIENAIRRARKNPLTNRGEQFAQMVTTAGNAGKIPLQHWPVDSYVVFVRRDAGSNDTIDGSWFVRRDNKGGFRCHRWYGFMVDANGRLLCLDGQKTAAKRGGADFQKLRTIPILKSGELLIDADEAVRRALANPFTNRGEEFVEQVTAAINTRRMSRRGWPLGSCVLIVEKSRRGGYHRAWCIERRASNFHYERGNGNASYRFTADVNHTYLLLDYRD